MVSRRAFFATLPLPFLLKREPRQCSQCGHQHMFPNYCGKDVWKAVNGLSMICECDVRKLGHHWTTPRSLSPFDPNGGHVPTARELFEQECRRDETYYRGVQFYNPPLSGHITDLTVPEGY